MFHNMTEAQLRETEELATLLADFSAKVAERMADHEEISRLDGPSALRKFACALRVAMAGEFSVGTKH